MKILVTFFGICIALSGLLTALSPAWFKPVRRYIDESRYAYESIDPAVFIGLGLFFGGVVIFVIGIIIIGSVHAPNDDPEEEE